jgi:glycosyltransferase involved in cell wall biosynthesis
MGAGVKQKVVLSGVNFTEMGPLSVFKEAIASLASEYANNFEIIALVHRKSLFDIPGVEFIEFPEIKSSWLKRLRFEYRQCLAISRGLKPHLWFAMHDMTPNVIADRRAVYCHNPSPFYPFSVKETLLDWKFGLFTLLYRFLYGIGIRSNDFVVVQQDWLRKNFQSRYGVRNVVVAHPSLDQVHIGEAAVGRNSSQTYRFFYPAYPRTFKNIEVILKAARRLERGGVGPFEVLLTIDGTETPYAAKMMREYSDLATVKWMGLQPRAEVMRLYGQANCLLFPSKLETWGMPITEFKVTGKPVLVADLPYAHETVGQYDKVAFFPPEDDEALSMRMKNAVAGVNIFVPHTARPIAEPFSHNWSELWRILLADEVREHPEQG